jgi:transporter family protein
MKPLLVGWQFWAVLSAGFAALAAIFAQFGLAPGYLFWFCRAAPRASWICYFPRAQARRCRARRADRQAERCPRCGVVFLGERLSGANWLDVARIAAGAIVAAYRF